jgi:hypothetical protein
VARIDPLDGGLRLSGEDVVLERHATVGLHELLVTHRLCSLEVVAPALVLLRGQVTTVLACPPYRSFTVFPVDSQRGTKELRLEAARHKSDWAQWLVTTVDFGFV